MTLNFVIRTAAFSHGIAANTFDHAGERFKVVRRLKPTRLMMVLKHSRWDAVSAEVGTGKNQPKPRASQ
jgi:hypothetical protein